MGKTSEPTPVVYALLTADLMERVDLERIRLNGESDGAVSHSRADVVRIALAAHLQRREAHWERRFNRKGSAK